MVFIDGQLGSCLYCCAFKKSFGNSRRVVGSSSRNELLGRSSRRYKSMQLVIVTSAIIMLPDIQSIKFKSHVFGSLFSISWSRSCMRWPDVAHHRIDASDRPPLDRLEILKEKRVVRLFYSLPPTDWIISWSCSYNSQKKTFEKKKKK